MIIPDSGLLFWATLYMTATPNISYCTLGRPVIYSSGNNVTITDQSFIKYHRQSATIK